MCCFDNCVYRLTEKLQEEQKHFRLELVLREEQSRVSAEISNERIRLQSEEITRVQAESQAQRQQAVAVERELSNEDKAQLEGRHKVCYFHPVLITCYNNPILINYHFIHELAYMS